MPVIGDGFAHFKILDTIGAGGMGAVYRVLNQRTGAEVALKILMNSGQDKELEIRFQREAQALKELFHPNIVEVGEAGVHNGVLFFSMELLQGQSLKTLLKTSFRSEDGFPDLEKLIDLFIDISDALAYCHKHGIVHRDIKPDNIVIENETERVILVDFGLARWLESPLDVESLTKSTDFLGTPHYMSPEQVGIFPERVRITEKTDVWSLGVMLFHALTGRMPFEGESHYNLFAAMVHHDPKSLSEYIPDLPKWLEQLCSDCLQKEAVQRPGMTDICERLTNGRENTQRRVVRTKSYWVLLASAILCLLLPIALYHYFTGQEALTLKLKGNGPRYLKSPVTVIRGRATPVGAKIIFNGRQSCFTDRNGYFEKEVKIGGGEEEISITLKYGDERLKATIPVIVDGVPPKIEMKDLSESKLNLVDGRIEGRLIDDNPRDHIIVDGEIVMLKEGRFSIDLGSPSKEQTLLVRAFDKAGHESRKSYRLLGKAAFARLQKRLLADRKAWAKANIETLDLIIARVSAVLKKDFDYLETKPYKCGGESHRIASFRHKKTKIVFSLLPGGTFLMGRKKEDCPYEKVVTESREVFDNSWDRAVITTPVQKVRIPAFLMGRYELRREIWMRMLGASDKSFPNHPVKNISWKAIKMWLTSVGGGLRLPSESEWEYACRAGTRTKYDWGDKYDSRYAFLKVGPQFTPIRESTALESGCNAFGLVNMIGNVAEWVEDEFVVNYKSHSRTERATVGGGGLAIVTRVIRGFSIFAPAESSQCAERMQAHPKHIYADIGFRVAMSLPKSKK
ncbi:MAG: bifunctional serine/threonine-protein kinase/formylglycine-generating enzyme family protein [Planctomycetota bacterium]|nr:bifunctional serine/threonine-protein kinase/formylglycine-generating enzyme family protein [Planctomycetota bacterium]